MIKNIFRISLLAALVCLFLSASIVQAQAINPNNLLLDADFQAPNMDAWRSWGRMPAGTVLEKVDTENGKSMHLRTFGANGGFQQSNVPVQPGHTYYLSFQYELSAGTIRPLLGIHTSNSDFEKKTELINFRTVGDSKVGTYVRYFTVPDNFAGDFRVVILLENGEALIAWPSVYEATPEYDPSSAEWAFADYSRIIRDPFMHMGGTAHWRAWGTPVSLGKVQEQVDLPGGRVAQQRLNVDSRGGNAGVQQMNISMQPGRYRLTFSYKVNSGSMTALLGMADSNRDFERAAAVLRPSNQWQDYSRVFQIPTATTDFRTVFVLKNGRGFIDNIMIEPLPNIAVEMAGSLQITASNAAQRIPAIVGTHDVSLGDFNLTAGSQEDIELQRIQFEVRNDSNDRTVWYDNYRLQTLDGQVRAQGQLVGDQLIFANAGLVVSRGQTVAVRVVADVQSPPLDPQVPTPDIVWMTLYPAHNGQQTVDVVGALSGVELEFDHVTYGPQVHDDEQVSGLTTVIQYTNISHDLGFDFPNIQPQENESFMRYAIRNANNPTNTSALINVVKVTIASENIDFAAGRKVRIYHDHVAPEQLIGSADIESVEAQVIGGITYRHFDIDIDDLEVTLADPGKFIVTLDLQDAAIVNPGEVKSVTVYIIDPVWSDGRSQDVNSFLDLIQVQASKVFF